MTASDFVDVSIDELEQRCVAALRAKGATNDEATAVFADYLDAEVRGRLSHGFMAFDVALAAFPTNHEAEIVARTNAVITVDGRGASGHVVARKAIDSAMDSVRTYGACVVGIRDIA